MATTKTALQRFRALLDVSARSVAHAIRLDPSGYHRIETGQNIPSRETARKIWTYYEGRVPLGVIYDPRHETSFEWVRRVEEAGRLPGRATRAARVDGRT